MSIRCRYRCRRPGREATDGDDTAVRDRRHDASRTVIRMGTLTLSVELPEELLALLGTAENAAAKAKQVLILDLLR